MTNRITVSLDESASTALESLVEETGKSRSEIVRNSVEFYAENLRIATGGKYDNLEAYHQMLSKGGHVLLDVDFLHAMLNYVTEEDGEFPVEFWEFVDPVASFHATEFGKRFDDIQGLLNWLALCGFLTIQEANEDTFQVVFPSKEVRLFMMRFIEKSSTELPHDIEVEEGVSKVIVKEKGKRR